MTSLSKRLMTATAMLGFAVGSAQADSVAYVAAYDYSEFGQPSSFGQLDLTTGVFTQIGNLNTGDNAVFGMGFGAGGQIYGVGSPVGPGTYPGELFGINPATGATTDLGSIPFEPAGAATDSSGTLYALNYYSSPSPPPTALYSMIPPSNAVNLIGNVSFSADGLVAIDANGNLFASGNGDGSFYEVNTTTLSTTLIGNTGLTGLFAGTFVGNTLYGISTNQYTGAETVVTIDTTNASVTFGAMISGLPENDLITAAAAPAASAVPEPESFVLGLLGGLGILASGLRRRRCQ